VSLLACTGDNGRAFDAGPTEEFPRGSVVTFADREEVERATSLESIGNRLIGIAGPIFHLVRLESGEFLALSARDSHSRCWASWRPDFEFRGERGWFWDPCHGSVYDEQGAKVFGPALRDLDRYPAQVRDEHVHVTLSDEALIPGKTR
jgi:Rieske Fe-S protein